MANPSFDRKKIGEALLRASKGKLNPDDIRAAQQGDASSLLASLGNDDRQKIQKLLNDPSALNKLLSDSNTRQLLQKLTGDNHG